MDKADDAPLDNLAQITPLSDDMDLVGQPDGDATETPASRRQPRGPNRPHAPMSEILFSLFHRVMGR